MKALNDKYYLKFYFNKWKIIFNSCFLKKLLFWSTLNLINCRIYLNIQITDNKLISNIYSGLFLQNEVHVNNLNHTKRKNTFKVFVLIVTLQL